MPRTGDRLAGRYELLAPIGSGGFATVFRGRDLWLGRLVAIKILLPNHSGDPVVAARFGREARSLAAISHPNVVAIHDVGGGDPASGSEPFLVMDLCEDGSLADLLAASDLGRVAPDILVPILVDVAAGLDALHDRGIVHRDLKPSNILLGDGRARIADLGIALAEPSELTARDTTVGTLAYLAPEQLTGEPASPASDVHALGVTAYLGLTGSLPRPAGNLAEIVAASRVPVPRVSQLAADLGTGFDRPIERALSPVAHDRQTAAELALAEPDPDRAGAGAWSWLGPAILGVAVATAIVLLTSFAGLGPGAASSPSPSVPAVASLPPSLPPTPSPTPSPTPTPTPTPTPSPPPTPGPFAEAARASQTARSAIQDARQAGLFKQKDARDLEARLDRFDRALERGDAGAARDEADRFAQEVADRLDGDGSGGGDAANALRAASHDLVAAANALPD